MICPDIHSHHVSPFISRQKFCLIISKCTISHDSYLIYFWYSIQHNWHPVNTTIIEQLVFASKMCTEYPGLSCTSYLYMVFSWDVCVSFLITEGMSMGIKILLCAAIVGGSSCCSWSGCYENPERYCIPLNTIITDCGTKLY